MQLFIKGEQTFVINCEEDDTIACLKERIAEHADFGTIDFNLYCSSTLLDDDILVGDLTTNSLDLTFPLIGGKVHGSLARAGKVRGQTPKVEKQEKKKKKTGRAKRRMQYNRRFVAVVPTYGSRRGPNANCNR